MTSGLSQPSVPRTARPLHEADWFPRATRQDTRPSELTSPARSPALMAVSTGLAYLLAFLQVTRPLNCLMAALLALLGLRLGGVAVGEATLRGLDGSGGLRARPGLAAALAERLCGQRLFRRADRRGVAS